MADAVQYKHWKGEGHERGTIVIKKKPNKVYIPDELEDAKSNHIYTDVISENGVPGRAYVAMSYEHEKYPKMLFHPKYHMMEPPNLSHFKETKDYEAAQRNWKEQYDRTQLAVDAKDEKSLLELGWLATPPEPVIAKSNPNSREI